MSTRADRRVASALRPLQAEFGVLDRADGSARFSFGSTGALASAAGPIEVRLREELPDRATLEVVHRPLEGIAATPSRALVNSLTTILPPLLSLGQHPRSLIQLVIQTLSPAPAPPHASVSITQNTWPPEEYPASNPGMTGMYFAAKAAALNAGTLALLDTASVAMRAVPVALSLAQTSNGLVLDPTKEEEDAATCRYIFGWAFGSGISSTDSSMEVDDAEAELVWAESEGQFSRQEYDAAAEQSKTAAKEILTFYRQTLGDHLAKRLASRIQQ